MLSLSSYSDPLFWLIEWLGKCILHKEKLDNRKLRKATAEVGTGNPGRGLRSTNNAQRFCSNKKEIGSFSVVTFVSNASPTPIKQCVLRTPGMYELQECILSLPWTLTGGSVLWPWRPQSPAVSLWTRGNKAHWLPDCITKAMPFALLERTWAKQPMT